MASALHSAYASSMSPNASRTDEKMRYVSCRSMPCSNVLYDDDDDDNNDDDEDDDEDDDDGRGNDVLL